MILKRALKMFIIFIVLSNSFRISTFAGQRKGLIAGYGLGIGATYREVGNNWFTAHNTRFNIASDFKLGIAPTNQFQFFLSLKSAHLFENPKEINPTKSEDVNKLLGLIWFPFTLIYKIHNLAGLGISYYLNPETPSLFFEGGFGGSVCYVKFDEKSRLSPPDNFLETNGFSLGIGYEFKKHRSVMLNVMGLHTVENNRYSKNRYDIVSIMLTYNYLAH